MEPLAPDHSGVGTRLPVDTRNTAINAGIVHKDASGVSFFARALKDSGTGTWLFSREGGGQGPLRFSAAVPFSVRSGDLVRASLSAGSDGSKAFRVLSRVSSARVDFVRSLGLVPDSVSLLIVAAARIFGTRMDAPRLVQLRAAVREAVASGAADEEGAAFAAVSSDDKGVSVSPEAIAAVMNGAHPDSSFRDKRRRREPRDEHPGPQGVKRAVSDFQSSEDPLAFMNALSGGSGKRWLAFPLGFRRGSVEIEASLRLLLNLTVSDPSRRVEHFALDVEGPSRFWSFSARGVAEALTIRADPPLGSESDGLREAFAAAFAPLGRPVSLSRERAERRLMDIDGIDPPAVFEDA